MEDFDKRLQDHIAASGFDVWDEGEDSSTSDLEEAMFGTRETLSASACMPFESTGPFRMSRTCPGSEAQGLGCTLPKTDVQGGTLNKRVGFQWTKNRFQRQ
eukprot:2959973-Amphidinium_carterae.1